MGKSPGPNPATDVGRDDPYALGREPKRGGDVIQSDVHPLARVVDGHALAVAVVTPDRQGRVRLEWVMVLGGRCVGVVEGDRRGRQRCLDITLSAIRRIEWGSLLRHIL